jgi:phosphotransferase system enzyme I (PtsI)
MISLKGTAASPGIAIGEAFVYKKEEKVQAKQTADIRKELSRFTEALEKSKIQLKEIKEKAAKDIGKDEAEIFEAHLLVLEDPSFVEDVKKNIEQKMLVAEVAVQETMKKYVELFEAMKSEYFKARALDIQDVCERVINNLLRTTYYSLAKLENKVIIIANILTPSDTAQINKEMILGFATDTGGITSHTAIIARSLGVPAVVGLGNVTEKAVSGDNVILDGFSGVVIINPDKEVLAQYERKKREYEACKK